MKPPPEFRSRWPDGPWWRGDHPLAFESQKADKDLIAERMKFSLGKTCQAIRRSAGDMKSTQRFGEPYEFIIYLPECPSLIWAAFMEQDHVEAWLRAYGCTATIPERPPDDVLGSGFTIKLPKSVVEFQKLRKEED